VLAGLQLRLVPHTLLIAAGDVLGWHPAHWPGATPLLCAPLDAAGQAVLSGLPPELVWTGLGNAPDLP